MVGCVLVVDMQCRSLLDRWHRCCFTSSYYYTHYCCIIRSHTAIRGSLKMDFIGVFLICVTCLFYRVNAGGDDQVSEQLQTLTQRMQEFARDVARLREENQQILHENAELRQGYEKILAVLSSDPRRKYLLLDFSPFSIQYFTKRLSYIY